ncbi:MAG: hypothetical protein H7A23_16805 [Leptospiraceae bacterium]|nr:hypothetical protein [Leptospiraceae bacterium]
MEFEKFIHNLPNTPTLIDLKNNYEKYYIDSSDKIIFVEVQDHIQIDTNSYIAGYLWDETVDGNGLAFAPFQSFELAKNYSPSFVQKGERPLNVIAFDFLQCASFDNINIPEMEPYLNAMLSMTDIEENYGYDRGSVIVIYFLESIKKWKTKNVKPLRNELRMKLKKYQKNQDKIV